MAEIKTQVSLSDIAEQIAEVVKQNRVNGTYTSLSAAIHKLDLMASAVLSANAGKVDAATALDLFEAEQQHILSLDPRERAMQHNYSRTMAVCYEFRQFIRKQAIDAGKV